LKKKKESSSIKMGLTQEKDKANNRFNGTGSWKINEKEADEGLGLVFLSYGQSGSVRINF